MGVMDPIIAPLFVPGNRPDRFAKASTSGADAVIYDLEDSVGIEDKEVARRAISTRQKTAVYEIVRVNSASSALLELDLQSISANPPSAVMLAKAERSADLRRVADALGARVQLIPLIETAPGLANLTEILASPNVLCAAFGSIDFALDIGCSHERLPLLSARAELVLRSRLAGCAAPIDGVTTAIDDAAQIEDDASHARAMGFGGKLAIHPRQIDSILSSFSATSAELAWARRVLNSAADGNARQLDGKMIDRPLIQQAERIVARFESMKRLREEKTDQEDRML
jgi:citrate lyase subunit beta/citryl-CoA lyase